MFSVLVIRLRSLRLLRVSGIVMRLRKIGRAVQQECRDRHSFPTRRSSDLLVRFPPTATKEIQYLNAKGALTYTDIAGDPVLYGNLPPREISMKDVFRSGDSSKKFKIAEGQWYRYAPSYVSPAYPL